MWGPMNESQFIIHHIGRLVTLEPQSGREGALGVIADAALVSDGGNIVWIGPMRDLPAVHKNIAKKLDAQGGVVLPGFVDCHTHLVHAGSREKEFILRVQGKSYLEIAQAGGGITTTVLATRQSSLEQLYQEAFQRADEALAYGITTLEIKTGYGLDVETELKILEVIRRLQQNHRMTFVATFLGAHTVPPEYRSNREGYLDLILKTMLPKVVAQGIAQAIDVFVEEGAFTADETRKIVQAGRSAGLKVRLHVDQLAAGGGAELAAEVQAVSADHLEFISEEGIAALKKSGTIAVLLPGATFFIGSKRFPPARQLIAAGIPVALSTDYNPGTHPSLNPWWVGTLAATQMKMTLDEVIAGFTKWPAAVLGLSAHCGSLAVGKWADCMVLESPNEYYPFYRYSQNCVRHVVKKGQV